MEKPQRLRAFLEGVASIGDIWGDMFSDHWRGLPRTVEEALRRDQEKLAGDWKRAEQRLRDTLQ